MGLSTSWGELAGKLETFAVGVPVSCQAATGVAAKAMKTAILGVARSGPHLPMSDGWVRTKVLPESSFVASLHGGFAMITEKGSYKKPNGYQINPYNNAGGVLASADGEFFAAHVHHPPQKPHPFWHSGVAVGLPLCVRAYDEALAATISRVF